MSIDLNSRKIPTEKWFDPLFNLIVFEKRVSPNKLALDLSNSYWILKFKKVYAEISKKSIELTVLYWETNAYHNLIGD